MAAWGPSASNSSTPSPWPNALSSLALLLIFPRRASLAKGKSKPTPHTPPPMKVPPSLLHLYAVTDRQWLHGRTLESQVRQVLEGGATIIQIREKCLGDQEFLQEARQIQATCREFGAPLIINDNVEVALAIGAGLHVGQSDTACREARRRLGEQAILGVSCATVQQALEAQEAGADYLGVGAVFPTSTKLDADWVKRETLREICQAVSIPVVAIGGISRENAATLAGTGIAGVAVVSALFAAPDPKAAAAAFSQIHY